MTLLRSDEETYRLPYTALPLRYELLFAPNLIDATFSGQEMLELDLVESTNQITMNAIELTISSPTIQLLGSDRSLDLDVDFDVDAERVTFTCAEILAPGRYQLRCNFAGVLNDKLCGFYRSSFLDEDGQERVIATTQFESTDARRAFPCFDEPDRKAVYAITLDAPADMLAISNGPEISCDDLGNGIKRVHFGDTIAMSTYLVCFIVGPLEATDPVDVDGVALRVVHLPGKANLCVPAIDIVTHALGFYGKYFAISYPSNKLDLVAIPDFAAGAMENLGCVTFREAILLADPDNVSQVELERLAEVVEHELAHMWFGDLVTMGWWNGIWLNEAFATYMSLLCQDDYRPEWQCFVSFARGKSQALAIDGLHATRPIEFPVRHPDESSAMFDVLTYEKGASVLWMIDAYLGGTHFRDGVRRYLKAHEYANTETADLWDAIEAEAGEVPIRSIMDSWIFQGGYPLVSATSTNRGATITLSQEPFSYLATEDAELDESAIGKNWLIPVLAALVGRRGDPSHVLLTQDDAELPASAQPTLLNAGGAGFYRLHYDDALRAGILHNLAELDALERYNFVADTWAVVLAGKADLDVFFTTVAQLSQEQDPHVWSIVIGALGLLDLTCAEGDRPALSSFTTALLTPQLGRIGWDRVDQEDEQTPVLRSALVAALGTTGADDETIAKARALFDRDHTSGISMDADLTSAVLAVVTAHATRAEFDSIVDRYRNPRSPMDQVRHLNALAGLRDPTMASEVHEMCLSEVRSQNAPFLLGGMLHNRFIGKQTWQFVVEHFDQLVERFPESSLHRMLEGIVGLVELDESGAPAHLGEIRTFLLSRIEGGKRRLIAQSLERLRVNLRLATRIHNRLGSHFAQFGASGKDS